MHCDQNNARTTHCVVVTSLPKAVNNGGSTFAPAVLKSLQHFDSLPNCAHVSLPVVMALFSCSRATVWRRVQAQHWPAPVKCGGRSVLWNVGQLRKVRTYANY